MLRPAASTVSRVRLFAEQIPARIGATDRNLRILWDLGAGLRLASFPTASTFLPPRDACCTATTLGSLETMPMPRT